MSTATSSHAYGIGIITVIVGMSVGLGYYQMFYLPEVLERPQVDEEILNPEEAAHIDMIPGSADPDQQDNFVPKLVNVQLTIDNLVIWTNSDEVAHTVTPDESLEDPYSGEFGSTGVVLPGESYEFLFTEAVEFEYHCEPHPWMRGTIIIGERRF